MYGMVGAGCNKMGVVKMTREKKLRRERRRKEQKKELGFRGKHGTILGVLMRTTGTDATLYRTLPEREYRITVVVSAAQSSSATSLITF